MNFIIQGDCSEEMGYISNNYIDLVVTSPPYDNLRLYNGYSFNFEKIANELYRIVKPGGVVVWIVNDATIMGSETGTSFKQALLFKNIGFNIHDTMIWNKGGFSAVGSLQCRYAPVFEYMFIFSKGKPKTFNPIRDRKNKHAGKMCKKGGTLRNPDGSTKPMSNQEYILPNLGQRFNIWEIFPNRRSAHPAPFPESLAQDHILSWSNPGDLVLDPMCGSGTTCIMAFKNKRNYIGIDISWEYCEIARSRIQKYTSEIIASNLVNIEQS